MAKCTMRVAVLLVSLGMLSPAFGFWFTTSRAKSQTPQWFGIRDYGGAAVQSAYSYDTSGGVTVAVPVAVPLSPQSVQMSPPYTGLGAVELVPCLCPIAKNPEAIKPLPVNAAPAPPVPVAMPPMQVMPMHTHQQQQQHQQHLQQQQQHQQQQHPQQPQQQHQHQPHQQQQQQHQPQQHQ